jgi:methionyl-tRNA formyltransferase
MPKSVYFLGSKPVGYHSLVYLYENRHELDIQIEGIVTNDNTSFGTTYILSDYASERGIPVFKDIDDILKKPVDYIISIQFHLILQKKHIDCAKILAINLHMAPLPEYRGCNQFSFAIIDGAKEFGTTIHRLEEGIDSGAIICEKRFPIPPNAFVKELYGLTEKASIELFRESIASILSGNFTLKNQDDFLNERSCSIHFRKEINEVKEINPLWPEEKKYRHIRATYMPGFEPPFSIINGQKKHYKIAPDGSYILEENTNQANMLRSGIRDVQLGEKVTIYEPVNLYECKIGNQVFIGPFVEIQKGVVIGDRCKVQSHTFICELVEIGNDCFISHGVMFINDTFNGGGPARGDKTKWKSTKIGNNVSLGSNATILPVEICDNVVVGAGSVVTKNITESGIYAGNPARKIR